MGRFIIEHYDGNGHLKMRRSVPNIFLNSGRHKVVKRLGTNESIYNYIAIGDDNTAAASTQTDLQGNQIQASIIEGAKAISWRWDSGNVYIRWIAEFMPSGTYTIEEAVLCDGATKGSRNCFCRALTGSIPLTVSDFIRIWYECYLS